MPLLGKVGLSFPFFPTALFETRNERLFVVGTDGRLPILCRHSVPFIKRFEGYPKLSHGPGGLVVFGGRDDLVSNASEVVLDRVGLVRLHARQLPEGLRLEAFLGAGVPNPSDGAN